jgi:predicted RNA-binding Zn-ribbon protein involved in translation (DUF1610 family)
MAIIKCPECGKEISSQSETCIHCGFSIKTWKLQKQYDEEIKIKLSDYEQTISKPQLIYGIDALPEYSILPYACFIASAIFFIMLTFLIIRGIYIGDWWLTGFLFCIIIGGGSLAIGISMIRNMKEHLIQQNKYIQERINNFDGYKRQLLNNKERTLRGEYAKKLKQLATPQFQMPIKPSILRCPNCGSTNIAKISTTDRIISTTMVGLASSKIGKTYECKHCKYKW